MAEQVLDGALAVRGDEGGGALGALLDVPGLDAAQPCGGNDVVLSDNYITPSTTTTSPHRSMLKWG